MLLLCALIVGSGTMWGADIVVTLDNIGQSLSTTANTTAATTNITATGTTENYSLNYYQCKKQASGSSYAMFMTKSVNAYISNHTAMPGNIKSVEVFIMSGAAKATTYDCAFSTTECNTATSGIGAVNITGGNSHVFSNLKANGTINVAGKYFCITLGNANNGQVLKLVITCESTDPFINASNPDDLAYNATNGTISYEIGNYTAGLNVTASTEANWISNFQYNQTNGSGTVSFNTSVNNEAKRSATVVLTLKNANNETLSTKNVTVTQAAIPPLVTIHEPTGGTLVVKNGDATVTSGDRLPVGTVLTIVPTADAMHKFKSWHYKKGNGNWVEMTVTFTYTIDANDVSFKATFNPTYAVNWSVNGTIASTTRFAENEAIVFPNDIADVEGNKFVGWVTETISGKTDVKPTFVTSATMGTEEKTYYAVFAEADEDGEAIEMLNQTLQYDTWTYSGTTSDMGTYRLFAENSYIESNSLDLSKLSKVNVYAGTYGNLSNANKKVSVTAGTTTWGTATLSTSNATTLNEITSNTTLTGNGMLHVVAGGGNGSTTGIRISKVEIFTNDKYSGFCTTVAPDNRTAVNMTGFTFTDPNVATTLVKGEIYETTVTNDQSGWTAAYTYESDNTDVADVDKDGSIYAFAKGTANITAKLNVDKDDPNYKAGDTKSITLAITVVNPSHNVTFSVNGTTSTPDAFEEGEDIEFPDVQDVNGYAFIGWLTAAIDGITESASPVTSATMGTSDVTYYAAYGQSEKKNVTATFDASDISNLTEIDTRKWKDNATGIEMYISNGQRYTGTPNAWNVTKSTSKSDYYMSIGKADCTLKKIEVTVTGTNYAFGDYYAYASVTDDVFEDGTSLTSTVSTEGTVSTLALSDDYEMVALWSGDGYQVRATKIVVDAITTIATGVCTTVPTSATVTISAAKWATYSSAYPLDFTGTCVTAYIVTGSDGESTITKVPVTKVPSKTGLLLKSEQGSYPIPVTAEETDDVTANKLVPVLTGSVSVEAGTEGNVNYVLSVQSGQVVFAWIGSSPATVTAGKAYLTLLNGPKPGASTGAPWLSIEGDDETTGINSVERGALSVEGCYTLDGRRVAQPTKGLYIVNGRKVIIK